MASSDEVGRLLDEGIEAVKKGDYPTAIQLWSQAIALDPQDEKALVNRATAYSQIGNAEGALADLSAALQINPNNLHAYFSRANLYNAQRKFKEALADLNKVIELNPDDAEAYYNRANTMTNAYGHMASFFSGDQKVSNLMGTFNQVMDDYTQAIKLNPNVAQFYANRSGIQFELLQRMQAQQTRVQQVNTPKMFQQQTVRKFDPSLADAPLKDINKALELAPNTAIYWKNRGVIKFILLNKVPEALADFTRAIELDPKFVDALVFRCNAYNRSGKNDLAAADATRCIELQPDEANHYFNRAIARHKLNDHQGALNDLDEVIQRDPKHIKAYPNRAECYTALGKKKEAVADWEQYLALGGGRMFGDEAIVKEKIKKLRSWFPFGR
ncbi:MAG: tetratricopeptide repeat protein [Anaerolineaceae bacterium]|nr:tetratricopeptide repeat protein [Anaerolineaceae bacterium]